MIEREHLIEFIEGLVTKEQLENVVSVGQMEELNRKLVSRLDVQQGQLDGLQALLGAMQVKITQLQLQVVKLEELLAVKDSEIAAAREKAEEMLRQETADREMAVENQTPVEPQQPEEPVQQENPVEPMQQEEPEKQAEPVQQEETIESARQPETVQPEQPAEKESTKEPVAKQTIADAIKGGESLAERLSKRIERETVAASLNSSKIDRIQTAITIADRFRFQRELFAGDAVKMAETVETLNNMKSLDEALAYIEKMFNWDIESPVTMDFIRIVERRF